jgi:hypothetical protein
MERERPVPVWAVAVDANMEIVDVEIDTLRVTVSVTVSLTSHFPSFHRSKFLWQAPVAALWEPSSTRAKSQAYAYVEPVDSVTQKKVYVVSSRSGKVVTGAVTEQAISESKILIPVEKSPGRVLPVFAGTVVVPVEVPVGSVVVVVVVVPVEVPVGSVMVVVVVPVEVPVGSVVVVPVPVVVVVVVVPVEVTFVTVVPVEVAVVIVTDPVAVVNGVVVTNVPVEVVNVTVVPVEVVTVTFVPASGLAMTTTKVAMEVTPLASVTVNLTVLGPGLSKR